MVVLHNDIAIMSASSLGITNNTSAAATIIPSPAALRYQQQRTLSNIGTASKTTISATQTMKRNNSNLPAAVIGLSKDDTSSASAPSATAVSSFANTASSSVSLSLQYYNNLLQRQMYNLRKSNKKKSKHTNDDANIWTVQMPRRILFGTMGIFLLIPVLIFVYKECIDEQSWKQFTLEPVINRIR